MSCDALRRIWNSDTTLSAEARKFMGESWVGGKDDLPPLYYCLGRTHIPRIKKEHEALRRRFQAIWNDSLTRLKIAQRDFADNAAFNADHICFISHQLLPSTGTLFQSCHQFGLPQRWIKEEKYAWVKKLEAILTSRAVFPENSEERMAFELALFQTVAWLRLSAEGEVLELNWIDLVREYQYEGKEEQRLAVDFLSRLKLNKEYELFFHIYPLPREVPLQQVERSLVNLSFTKFANRVRVEQLRPFRLKIPEGAYPKLEKALNEAQDAIEPLSVLYIFKHVQENLTPKAALPALTKELLNMLELFFSPESPLKKILLASLLYTMTLEYLSRKGFLLEPGWESHFFEASLTLASEQWTLLFSRINSLPSAPGAVEGVSSNKRAVILHTFKASFERKWVKPPHLLWVFCSDLIRAVQVNGDFLNSEELICLIDKIQAYLGHPLSEEMIYSLLCGDLVKREALAQIALLETWRKDNITTYRGQLLPPLIQNVLKVRGEKLSEVFADTTLLKPFRVELMYLLWFSTYLSAEVMEIPLRKIPLPKNNAFDTAPADCYPEGYWFSITSRAESLYGAGPQIRCRWTSIAKRSNAFSLAIHYSPSLKSRKSICHLLNLSIGKDLDMVTYMVLSDYVGKYLSDDTHPRFGIGLQNQDLIDAIHTFFEQVKIALKELPGLCMEPIETSPLPEILKKRMTFPMEGGASLLPPQHPLAKDPMYSIYCSEYANVLTLIPSSNQLMEIELIYVMESGKIPVKLRGEPKGNKTVVQISVTIENKKITDQVAFPNDCDPESKDEALLGLLIQFKSLLYSTAMHSQLPIPS